MHRNKLIQKVMLLAAGLFAFAAPAALTGCNTTSGLGEDIEAAGDAIEDSANDAAD